MEARQYLDMTSWCIVISEESFKAYTANGNRFYFYGNGEWREVPRIPGNSFPRDRLGYSLIAVEVTPDNQIASMTSRWNNCAGDTGEFIPEDELKSILGIENYNKLLCKCIENHYICNMVEDTKLTQFIVEPIDPMLVFSSAPGEKAYSLKTVNRGECKNEEEEQSKLAEAEVTPNTLGFELDFEVDMYPYELVTYTADKKLNAHFGWGGHAPGEKNYPEKCRFKPGDKVLCVIHRGYEAVIPAIVVEPLGEQHVIQWYKKALEEGYGVPDTFEEFLETHYDWDWDAVIVRPLVRLKSDWDKMGETETIQRVYLFPYKTFEI